MNTFLDDHSIELPRIYRGATYSISIYAETDTNWSTWAASMVLKDRLGGTTFALWSTGGGQITISYDSVKKQNRIDILVNLSATALYNFSKAVWELELTTPSSQLYPILGGTVSCVDKLQ